MSETEPSTSVRWALQAARCAGDVANYCDHAEHNEATEREWVLHAARSLRSLACEIAVCHGVDLQERYAARLRAVEERNPLCSEESPDGALLALEARTWRDLQLVQATHDRHYHPDVLGLSKLGQLHHYALHLSKLAGATAALAEWTCDVDDFRARRLPDMLVFGIKLSTVVGQSLPETQLGKHSSDRVLTVA